MQTRTLSRKERRAAGRYLERRATTYEPSMAPIANDNWPPSVSGMQNRPIKAFRSCNFFAAFYNDPNGYLRMSVQRVTQFTSGNWKDGITWDELQEVKEQCGYGEAWMVETFPPRSELVNVANIRHLFLLPEAPTFAWRKHNDRRADEVALATGPEE